MCTRSLSNVTPRDPPPAGAARVAHLVLTADADAMSPVEFEVTCLDALFHRRPIGRLDSNDENPGIVTLDRHRDSGNQSSATNWYDDGVDFRPILDDLETEARRREDVD